MCRKLFLLWVMLTLTACSPIWQTRPAVSPEALAQARQIELLQLNNWKIQGRTVIRNKQEAWNVGLRWQQNNDEFQIQLLGPFAQGGVSIEGNDKSVIMTMDDGQKLQSTNPEALIAKTLGVQLPIDALRFWIRGLPYQQSKVELVEYDEKGRITHLIQQGWNVDFKRYVPFKQYSLPSKIFITRADRSLRLVITSWKDSL
ncbi:MAG: outer membrane lipoprotein LolB [Methylophaga sp.]|nr:MAG: outer membrane lipoprotein LolB [Methylophaga sp.]